MQNYTYYKYYLEINIFLFSKIKFIYIKYNIYIYKSKKSLQKLNTHEIIL